MVIGAARVAHQGRTEVLASAWQRNHAVPVVEFGLDGQGRLIGEVSDLADSLDTDELAFCLTRLIDECDRYQSLLIHHDEF